MGELSKKIVGIDKEFVSFASRISYYPMVIESAKGNLVFDADGKSYIDFLSGAAVMNVGHSHPKIIKAIKNQADKFIHYTSAYMYHESQAMLAKKLVEITPGNFRKRVSFGLSGSDANDGVIKIARAYTGRSKIIAFNGSYHGSTYGALSISNISLNMKRKIGPLLPDIFHFDYPDCYRCLNNQVKESCSMACFEQITRAFNQYLPIEEVAAIIIEPLNGDNGFIEPPYEFMQKLYKLCKENGILFVSEEIQQGFGRTGKWFGIEHYDIEPDIIVLGKAIASGIPLSAIVARSEIMESIEAPAHIFTTAGNPIACEASLAMIDVLEEEKLLENAIEMGEYIKEKFAVLAEKFEIIGDIRGKGLSIGIDLVKNRFTKEKYNDAAVKICYRCWEKGLILIFVAGSVLRIQPSLTITKVEIYEAIKIIESSIIDFLNNDIPDGIGENARGW